MKRHAIAPATALAKRASRQGLALVLCAVALLQTQAWAATTATVECPNAIRVAYAESELPPYILGIGEELQDPPGLFVAWTRAAVAKLGCTAALQERRFPYNRIINGMQMGDVDVRVSAGYREAMARIAHYPIAKGKPDPRLAIAEGNTALYVVKGNKTLKWNGTTLRAHGKDVVVGTVLGHFSEMVLRERQWHIDSAPNWDSNVQKLLQGRVSAIAGTASVIDALPDRSKLQRLDPPVAYDYFFAPVANPFYDRYPEFTQKFWYQICLESRAYFKDLPACALNP